MKKYIFPTILLAFTGLGSLYGEEPVTTMPRLRPTHQELENRRAEVAKQEKKPPVGMVELKPGVVKPRKREVTSLVARSTVISFGGFWTIVPKGAVLHIPEGLKPRIGGEPSGRLLTWSDFFARNRGWMVQQAVEVGHARGEKELPEEVVTHFQKGSQVVVATCHNGPISMKKSPSQLNKIPQSK